MQILFTKLPDIIITTDQMKRYHIIQVLFFLPIFFSFKTQAKETANDWPREISIQEARIVIYQPQIENFTGDILESRVAIAVIPKDTEEPVFGAAWFVNRVSTDLDTRMVTLEELKVTNVKFPDASEENINKLIQTLEKEMPKWTIELSLDRLLASLDEDKAAIAKTNALNNDAPEVIFSTKPSILVLIDGDPVFKEMEGLSQYQYVVNTPFFIVKDVKKKTFFLFGDRKWYASKDINDGWTITSKVPDELEQIAQKSEEEKKKEMSPEDLKEYEAEEPIEAAIFIRTSPAELIQSDGKPEFGPIEGTQLLYMTNTENDVLMDISSQQYYILISGRWYKSKSMNKNNWEYVLPEKLPADFSKIPADSDMGTILPNVAGTPEAQEALLENTIPQTATVDRKTATVEVKYDGKPKFKDIEGTKMSYAENTDKSVLKIENTYYCVDDGIWFEATNPEGPWKVSVEVPEEVQDIPPESPVYNVKYVYVYDYTPEVAYVGYTPGYMGSYIYHGCVVYGTGYYYRPWYHHYYYPRPVTYGFGVHYNPYSGWGFSFGISFGWMSISFGRPHYGWWGPAGYHFGYRHGYRRGYHHGYNRGFRAGYYAGNRNRAATYNRNIYNNRSSGIAKTRPKYNNNPSNRIAVDNRKRISPNTKVPKRNDVFTDKSGNIYKKTNDGWKKYDKGAWKNSDRASTGKVKPTSPSTRDIPRRPSTGQKPGNATRPATRPSTKPGTRPATKPQTRPSSQPSTRPAPNNTYKNLNKSYQSRQRGTQRTQNYRSMRSRPSGGARPSGGRRR
jgi:hypothetical protein